MKKSIAVLPGDGIGPEVIESAINILKVIADKCHHTYIFNYGLIGACAINKTGSPLPEETVDLCKTSDAILFGAIGDPKYDNDPSAKIRPEQGILKLRKELDLYANLRPIKIMPELADISPLKKEKIKDVDIMVIRELTGGIYFGKHERVQDGNSAIDISQYSKFEIIRIANMAFELALHRNKKVFSVDKANVLETSRLWRETVNDIATKFPEVSVTHMFIDNAAMQLIKRPSEFDVLLTENMFGDILTDEASMIAGSIGLLPSASIGDKYALYEPIHGSYNKAAGLYVANPIGTILSAAMMLRMSFKMKKEAEIIEKAIHQTLKKGFRTRDICGINTKKNHLTNSKEFTAYVIQGILDSNPS